MSKSGSVWAGMSDKQMDEAWTAMVEHGKRADALRAAEQAVIDVAVEYFPGRGSAGKRGEMCQCALCRGTRAVAALLRARAQEGKP